VHTRSRGIPSLIIVDDDDAPALPAEHLCGSQSGRPTADDRYLDM
jgi:hypothetical protein